MTIIAVSFFLFFFSLVISNGCTKTEFDRRFLVDDAVVVGDRRKLEKNDFIMISIDDDDDGDGDDDECNRRTIDRGDDDEDDDDEDDIVPDSRCVLDTIVTYDGTR
jgi:hypothetical protein